MNKEIFNRVTVLVFTLGITAVFVGMIKGFLMAIFMAAIFAGLLYPVYSRILKRVNGKTTIASMLTILFLIFIILIPLSGILLIIIEQAIAASDTAGPMLREIMVDTRQFLTYVETIPIVQKIFPDEQSLINSLENVVKGMGDFVVNGLTAFSSGAAHFIFAFFIFLFTLFYFLIYGKDYLDKLLYYFPLTNQDEKLLLSRFMTVTKATLKGTFLIGLIQGALGAIGMAVAGLSNVVFWGLVMAVMSIIPAVGPAIIWLPAAIFLMLTGQLWSGIILLLFGAIVIGNIDNLLRPTLVGKSAQMPDLMILFSTLGGLALFGMAGIIIGPIIGALFMTSWEIYGTTFSDRLTPTEKMVLEETEKKDRGGSE